jgi:hypothetical protein
MTAGGGVFVGTGMQTYMATQQDHPVYGHEQGQNEDGSQFERCWGAKGLYISSNASGEWENVGPFWRPRSPAAAQPILTADGQDIRGLIVAASASAGIPPALLLGCISAESDLDPRAERWGTVTQQAKAAIAAQDHHALKALIGQAWTDISFGLAQRIVKFHYFGDQQATVENVVAVRQYVFDHRDRDLSEAAAYLKADLALARHGDLSLCHDDELLGACIVYNCGHFPSSNESYWSQRASTIARYRTKLEEARAAFPG